jgi:hypothetical protein
MKAEGRVKIQIAAILAFIVFAAVGFSRTHLSKNQGDQQKPAATALWRPRKEVKDARFVGSNACTQCHEKISALQHHTLMSKALALTASCEILISHRELTLRDGPYVYRIVRSGDRSLYTVTDGTKTISEPILYCFGQGKAGQTYVFKHNDSFYESRMSFFKEINGLDYTIGYSRAAPPTLDEAAGRAISSDEAKNCFSCHATGAVGDDRLQLVQMMPGVGCEACHGPGGKHVLAMKSQKSAEPYIFDPANLDADELGQEFCGACHRSVDEVSHMPNLGGGINNVRFQPYRLFLSPGHNPTDPRLSCTACHDPHDNPSQDAAFYDAKCFACHQSGTSNRQNSLKGIDRGGRTARACPKSNKLCITCHMPQVEIPGSHFKFTDHRIRIVRPGDPYPN